VCAGGSSKATVNKYFFTFTTNAFLLKQKYLFTVAFELPPAHTNPQKMLILIRQIFLLVNVNMSVPLCDSSVTNTAKHLN
jgi:TRAP-type mannitol/chloroaromatic compound transport system permease small subunit